MIGIKHGAGLGPEHRLTHVYAAQAGLTER